jgi:hypothetical protein
MIQIGHVEFDMFRFRAINNYTSLQAFVSIKE